MAPRIAKSSRANPVPVTRHGDSAGRLLETHVSRYVRITRAKGASEPRVLMPGAALNVGAQYCEARYKRG